MTNKDLQNPDSDGRPVGSGRPRGAGEKRTSPEPVEETDSTIEAFDREGAGIAAKE